MVVQHLGPDAAQVGAGVIGHQLLVGGLDAVAIQSRRQVGWPIHVAPGHQGRRRTAAARAVLKARQQLDQRVQHRRGIIGLVGTDQNVDLRLIVMRAAIGMAQHGNPSLREYRQMRQGRAVFIILPFNL